MPSEDQQDELGAALEYNISSSEFVSQFPRVVQERLGETKQSYYHLFDVFVDAMEAIPYFEEVSYCFRSSEKYCE